jgi:hypothetical protein
MSTEVLGEPGPVIVPEMELEIGPDFEPPSGATGAPGLT